tara:strand:- start:155122 stop:157059 length:1938 start_codon:yes stop_codon:yes gene_type:complete
MSDGDFSAIAPATITWPNGEPFSSHFNTRYFCRTHGLAEAREVFVEGNALTKRFNELHNNQHFVIGETRFGAGLNFLVTAQAFLQHAADGARLHYVAAEAQPLSQADLAQALKLWPTLEEFTTELITQYPSLTPGFHRQTLYAGRITLTLMFGDTHTMLAQLPARVDAWFLDGFAPANDPLMWQASLFECMAQLSHAGTTIASNASEEYVQQGLAQVGFALSLLPCSTRNREIITGTWIEKAPYKDSSEKERPHLSPQRSQRIAIIGAGLAGVTTAAALTQRGYQVQLFDRAGVASGASGNLAGVVYTTPSAHPTPQNRFYQSSYLYALKKFRAMQFPSNEQDGAITGVLQLAKNERLAEKALAALRSGLWPAELLSEPKINDTRPLKTPENERRTNTHGALVLHQAGYISAPQWCGRLVSHANLTIIGKNISQLSHLNNGSWQLTCDDASTASFDHVILANAAAALNLVSLPDLKLKNIRGQVSYVKKTSDSEKWPYAICHAGYLTPAINGLHCVGATFDIEDSEPKPRDDDDRKNIEQLKEYLPKQWRDLGGDDIEIHSRRVGFRCQSTDFLPLVGSLADIDKKMSGLWLNIAHGSRGITGTPLSAEILACMINGEPLPIDHDMLAALAPVRFTLRQAKRNEK